MGKFKRWIASLFDIQVEDLPQKTQMSDEQITTRIHEEVTRQVNEQLRLLVEKTVLQETNKTSEIENLIFNSPAAIQISPVVDATDHEKDQDANLPSKVHTQPIFTETNISDQTEERINTEIPNTDEPLTDTHDEFHDGIAEEILPLDIDTEIEKLESEESKHLRPLEDQKIHIGIDFGTTTTVVSMRIGEEKPEALPIGNDGVARFMPSIVYFQTSQDGFDTKVVGEEAESFGDQAHVIRSVKRCIGCSGGSCLDDKKKNIQGYPFPWCKGDGKIHVNEHRVTEPIEVAYLIVREGMERAIKVARDKYQIDLTKENVCFLPVNLGCGANFDLERRELIQGIAKELGFQKVTIENVVEEPILSGFTFSRFAEKPEGRVLIYDFGGGTFDVAIVDVDRVDSRLRVTVLATAGDNWLGGDDIDKLIFDHFIDKLAQDVNLPITDTENLLDDAEKSRLRSLVRGIKENLSKSETAEDVILSQNFGPINLTITRKELEIMLEQHNIFSRSLDAVTLACRMAYAFENASKDIMLDYQKIIRHEISDAVKSIDRVVLVGGVTKTPYIRNSLNKLFGEGKIVEDTIVEPISAVAIGAAYPREPQHYSICYPPYRIFVKYSIKGDKSLHEQTIFAPFEFIDFHKYFTSNFSGDYFTDVEIQTDWINTAIYFQRVGSELFKRIKDLGTLSEGTWRFIISIEGELMYHKKGETSVKIGNYPGSHPVQLRIVDARENRQRANMEKLKAQQGNFSDWTKEMMNEN